MEFTGAQALVKSLEMEEVEVIFGLPGGAILPVYDPIIDSPIRHILVRHEQGAGHMAEGYAHATGRPGVAMVTSGPGATNIVTPLADAYMDSIPLVCISGQVATSAIGTDAFQESDTTGITLGVTKHNWLVTDAADIPQDRARGIPYRDDRPSRPGAHRLPQGRRQLHHGVVLARRCRPARVPSGFARRPGCDPRRRRARARRRTARDLRRGRDLEVEGLRGPARAGGPDGHPCRDDSHGPRLVPRQPPALPRHARYARQLHSRHRHAEGGLAACPGKPFRRSCDRQGLGLRPRGKGRARRHRQGRDRQGQATRGRDPGRLPVGDRSHV